MVMLCITIFFSFSNFSNAQSYKEFAEKHLDTLCSKTMHGRGYVFNGDRKAALYIRDQFKKFDLKSFNNSFFQYFNLSVNSFPGKMNLNINGKPLQVSDDYVVYPSSKSGKGNYDIQMLDTSIFYNKDKRNEYFKHFNNSGVLAYPSRYVDSIKALNKVNITKIYSCDGIIEIMPKKPDASISTKQYLLPYFKVYNESLPANLKSVNFELEANHKKKYTTSNVVGYIPGKSQKDSFVVITAHYDHLGHMGKDTYFPGANDNASGTSFIIELARFYSKPKNKLPFNIVFIAFSGEETGLLGSKYYTNNPLFSLDKIKFLLNLDMMGNGQKGITVVNGKTHKKEFQRLRKINKKGNYVPEVKIRGAAANSDHYYFSENGVRAFFIYTRGSHNYYHDINDNAENLKLEKFNALFEMITKFIKGL